MTPPRGVEDAAPLQWQPGSFIVVANVRGGQRAGRQLAAATLFPGQFFARQTGTGEQCSPLQAFFDSLSLPPWGKVPEAPPEGG